MSSESLILSPAEAGTILLSHHSLTSPQSLKGEVDALEYIRKMGCIQYDPLNVCGRNADLVLQSRIDNYRGSILEDLLYGKRSLLDGWDKMMAIYPVEDRPILARLRREISGSYIKRY
ncbi:MAG: crosslink repair DNA glycosylase YcaQ family protein, partial [Spirochaetales bacterium]|nr:crosslink repair DNA glycosylase YcaQ family protein [Spirochaetales bacterium]